MDLCTTSATILTPDSPPVALPTGVFGPLPSGTVGLILGRSSTALQGIPVMPGVIDANYKGEIKVMIGTPTRTIQLVHNQRIAHILLLPYVSLNNPVASSFPREKRGFGSSDATFWIQEIRSSRPIKTLRVQGKAIEAPLDTGADVSCIVGKDWPRAWPTKIAPSVLGGLGKAPDVVTSSQILTWKDDMLFPQFLLLYGEGIFLLKWGCYSLVLTPRCQHK